MLNKMEIRVKKKKNLRLSRKAAGFRLLFSAAPSVWSAHFQVPMSERVMQAAQRSSDSAGQKGEFIGRKL